MANMNGLASALDVVPPPKPKRPARPRAKRATPAPAAKVEQTGVDLREHAVITFTTVLDSRLETWLLPPPRPRPEVWWLSHRERLTLPLEPKNWPLSAVTFSTGRLIPQTARRPSTASLARAGQPRPNACLIAYRLVSENWPPEARPVLAGPIEPPNPETASTAKIPAYVDWLIAFCLVASIGGLWLLSSWVWLLASWI